MEVIYFELIFLMCVINFLIIYLIYNELHSKKPDYQKINEKLDNLTQDELYSLTSYILNKKMSDKTFKKFKEDWFVKINL